MASRSEQILDHVASLLTAAAGVPTVYRSRVEAFSRDEAPVVVVEPAGETAVEFSTCKLDWTLPMLIAIHTRGAIPDQLADPIRIAVHSALMADRTLGGLAINISPSGTDPQRDKADLASLWLVCTYQVRYRTLANDLETG